MQSAFAALDPEEFARRRAREGAPFLVRLPGFGETLVSGSPEGARDRRRARGPVDRGAGAAPVEVVARGARRRGGAAPSVAVIVSRARDTLHQREVDTASATADVEHGEAAEVGTADHPRHLFRPAR